MNNSFDTAMSLMEDMASGLVDLSAARAGSQSIAGLLEKRGTHSALLITSLVFKICRISVFKSRTAGGSKVQRSKMQLQGL